MRAITRRVVPWLSLLSGCSADQAVLLIHVKSIPSDVASLRVSAQLDGKSPQQAEFTQGLDAVAVTLSKDTIGQGQLNVSMLAVGMDGCSSSGAQHKTTLRIEAPYTEIELALAPLTHRFCRVPKGSFRMGSPATEVGRGTDEAQHTVTLTTDFWMADSEVTQRQWQSVTGNNPSNFKGDELPVEQVSWFDAVGYCNALSLKEGLLPCYQINGTTVGWADGLKCSGYRLPTEAEWEYAARSPATTVYAGSDNVDQVAWYTNNDGNTTHAVRTKAANGRRLYDLSGNVWEWVWDWYQSNYEALPATDPIGTTMGVRRVIRGGSWLYASADARVAMRADHSQLAGDHNIGFRVVRSFP